MKCLIRFLQTDKCIFKVKYEDNIVENSILRTIYVPEKCGRFLKKRINRLCQNAEKAEDYSLWLAFENIEGIADKAGKGELVIFAKNKKEVQRVSGLLLRDNISIVTDREGFDEIGEYMMSVYGSASVFLNENYKEFQNKNILLLSGFFDLPFHNAKKIINLSGNAIGCEGEILPENIRYEIPSDLKEATLVWDKRTPTLSALIKFYNFSPNLHIFSL